MWKRTKWINTRMEKVINRNLYFNNDIRLLTVKKIHEYDEKIKNRDADIAYTRKMLGYGADGIESSDPIIEEIMSIITSAPSLIL